MTSPALGMLAAPTLANVAVRLYTTSTHTHKSYQLPTYSLEPALTLTVTVALTLYDPGIPQIPQHTLLTLLTPCTSHEIWHFCKPATSPVDSYMLSVCR